MTGHKRLTKILVMSIGCLMLMLVFSGFTSPLYPHYIGLDTAVFFTIAKGFANGKIPYAGLFDHKGPVFYLMYIIGYMTAGRMGVFLLQCVLLLADFILIEKIACLFRVKPYASILVFLALFLLTFEHGGMTEEFSMPFILIGMYYELRFLISEEEKHDPGIAFLYGVILGALVFIRMNNAIVLCALLLGIIAALIQNQQWVNILINIICGIAGLLVIAIPVCSYYYWHGALNDMVYGTFLHNLVYAKNNTHYPILSSSFLYFLILFLPAFYAMGVFWKKWKTERNRLYASLLFATALTYAMLAYTNVYLHYFMLGIPLVITAAAADGGISLAGFKEKAASRMAGKESKTMYGISFSAAALTGITAIYMLLSVLSACAPVYKTYLSDIALREYEQVQEGLSVIPEEERDSVIAYDVLATYYYHADIIPCYKYFTLQRWLTTEKINVNREFMHYVAEEHPLWVVIPTNEKNKTIHKILDAAYACKWSDEAYSYYRYQEDQT